VKLDEDLRSRKGGLTDSFIDATSAEVLPPPVDFTSKAPQPLATFIVSQFFGLVRSRPNFLKVEPLLSHFRSIKGKYYEQRMILEALAFDFCLSFAHLGCLCRAGGTVAESFAILLPTLPGGVSQRYLAQSLLLRDVDSYVQVRKTCHQFLKLNLENPTGHYLLDLSSPCDYEVANILCLVDRWEAAMARKTDCKDMSKHGNWSSVRNCVYQSNNILSFSEICIPPVDRIELDFVSWRRGPAGSQAMEDSAWQKCLLAISTSWSRTGDKLEALHRISGSIWVRAMQLRELIGLFPDAKSRVEVLVSFVLRLADPQNMKVSRACVADHSEWVSVTQRLGTLALFPHYQPEEYHFDLSLDIYEDRMATAMCVQLASEERLENMRNPKLINPDGSEGSLEMGISRLCKTLILFHMEAGSSSSTSVALQT